MTRMVLFFPFLLDLSFRKPQTSGDFYGWLLDTFFLCSINVLILVVLSLGYCINLRRAVNIASALRILCLPQSAIIEEFQHKHIQ